MVLPLGSVLVATASLSLATCETAAPWFPSASVWWSASAEAVVSLSVGDGVADSGAEGLGSGEGDQESSATGATVATAGNSERTSSRIDADATPARTSTPQTMAATIQSGRMLHLRRSYAGARSALFERAARLVAVPVSYTHLRD